MFIPPSETLVSTKTCRHCSAPFPITDKDLEFYEKVSPSFLCPPDKGGGVAGGLWVDLTETPQPPLSGGLKKYLIPTPTLCPDCRRQRRLSFRNERHLYKRNCDATGKSIVSIYSPDKPFKVYHQDFWWSDAWDPTKYGRDFDFSRGFFEQYGALMLNVPHFNIVVQNAENSEYTNGGIGNRNCYMVFLASNNENGYYNYWTYDTASLVDCSSAWDSSHCYECLEIENCMSCFFSSNLKNSSYCYHSSHLVGCSFCIDCENLQNASYMVRNTRVTPEQFQEELKKVEMIRKPKQGTTIARALNCVNCENVAGDDVTDVHNGYMVFEGKNGSDFKYVYGFSDIRDCYDTDRQAYDCDHLYECYGVEKDHGSMGLYLSAEIDRGFYNVYCFSCKDIFGCFWLRNKQYCIFNKQYTRAEYEELVPKIIEHMMHPPRSSTTPQEGNYSEWGEFFPSSLSPFGYNETVAQEYYPLTPPPIPNPFPPREKGDNTTLFSFSPGGKDAWKADRGIFNWSFYEAPFPKVEKIIPASKLPDDIAKIPDDILTWAIECEVTKRPFRIIKQELEFYRKHNLPIPRRHPDQRHLDRMALRNPRKLFERKCDKCQKEMITTYAPERLEIVYCEECYNKEIL